MQTSRGSKLTGSARREVSESRAQLPPGIHRVFLSADIRRDGSAAFAWWNVKTGKRRKEDLPSATKIEAAYTGLLSVLASLPEGTRADIFSDSALLSGQFYEISPVRGHQVQTLAANVLVVIRRRKVTLAIFCVPRANNPAWQRLRRRGW